MRCLVLLADDYDDGREILAFFLRREGLSVTEIPDGEAVMALAVDLLPEVILLDLTLPGVDGFTLIEQLQAHPATKALPIVVLSAHAYKADEDRAVAAGARIYLRKPCPPPEVVAAIRAVSLPCETLFAEPSRTVQGLEAQPLL